jgi:hypothetical protein
MIKGLAVLGMAAGLAVIAIPATAPDLRNVTLRRSRSPYHLRP